MTSVRTKVKSPVSLSYTYSATDGFAATINWNAKAGAWPASYYILYRKLEDEVSYSVLATGLIDTTYRDSTIVEGGRYSYAASTVNIHEIESDDSDQLAVVLPSFPVWDTGWSLSINQNATENISGHASDPDDDALTFSRNGGTAPAGVTVSSAGVVAVGASVAGSYTLIIAASNGLLGANTTVSLSVNAVGVAMPPTSYNAVTASSSQINHSWVAPVGGATVTGYELDRSSNGTTGWANRYTGAALSYADTALNPLTQYFYRLRTLTAVGPSTYVTDDATTAAAAVYDTPDYTDPVAGLTLQGGRTTVNVSTASALISALTNAVAGQTIQLAAGNYAANFTMSKTVPANNPIIVKGAANFGSVITGALTMTGAYQIVTGIHFNGSGAKISYRGFNNKILANKFTGWTTAGVISGSDAITTNDARNEIAYNEIGPPGAQPTGTFRWAIKQFTGSTEITVQKHNWVHHNLFTGQTSPDGRADAIEIGESGTYSYAPTIISGWYIEDNLFTAIELAAQHAVDIKLGGTVFRRNTITNSSNVKAGARFGRSMILESNYFENGRLFVLGGFHIVAGNIAAIDIAAGSMEWDAIGSDHPRAHEALVSGNAGTLRVGYVTSTNYNLPARNTLIRAHSGSVLFNNHTGTVDERNLAATYLCAPAVKLTSGQVGPAAIVQAPAAYKAARGL